MMRAFEKAFLILKRTGTCIKCKRNGFSLRNINEYQESVLPAQGSPIDLESRLLCPACFELEKEMIDVVKDKGVGNSFLSPEDECSGCGEIMDPDDFQQHGMAHFCPECMNKVYDSY